MKRRIALALLATSTALMLLPAAEAWAEPAYSATLDDANPTFTWASSGSGAPDPSGFLFGPAALLRCSGGLFSCEHILLDVQAPGELTLTLENTDAIDPSFPSEVCGRSPCQLVHDVDGYLYRSNAAGEPQGNNLTWACATVASSETCTIPVWRGFYLVEVEHYIAVDAHYTGTVELVPAAPGPQITGPQMVTLDDCNFSLYYFKDSAERLQAVVPPRYRVRPYPGTYVPPGGMLSSPLVTTEGSATIAASAYDCGLVDVPGSSPAPAIFTVLSVLVYPPDGTTEEGAASSDFYVLWVHANSPQLVELLASHGMPADLVPGMVFEKPLQSVGVRVEVPWSPGAYELETTAFEQDFFHAHDMTYLHVAEGGRRCHGDGEGPRRECLVRMDFVTRQTRDHYCSQPSDDHHAIECGNLTAHAGTPVASFFGASDRTADSAWDHEPLEHSWLVLQ